MEAIHSSETSIDFQQTTRCYVPEERILHNRHYDSLKSYEVYYVEILLLFVGAQI
jgi:hypothetical protein